MNEINKRARGEEGKEKRSLYDEDTEAGSRRRKEGQLMKNLDK